MCCKNFWLRIIPFLLAFTVGSTIVNVFQKESVELKQNLSTPTSEVEHKQKRITPASAIETLKINSKARADYTAAARQNQTEGTVSLRVTFLASGEIGSVSVVNALPDGLTEQAIAAAKKIKFEPAKKDGVPVTVIKQVQYSFSIY